MNQVIESMLSRRSVRSFVDKPIDEKDLDTILECGLFAANGRGLQSAMMVLVKDKEVIQELSKMNAEVMGVTFNPYYDAPTYILVFVPADAPNGVQDASLVMENMMLAAHAQGLGSCWIHREREIFATEEGKKMMQEWGLPEGLIGIAALALGYPNGNPSPAKPRKEGYTRVIR